MENFDYKIIIFCSVSHVLMVTRYLVETLVDVGKDSRAYILPLLPHTDTIRKQETLRAINDEASSLRFLVTSPECNVLTTAREFELL